jgi:NADH-quinone oxidoreductase subunit J
VVIVSVIGVVNLLVFLIAAAVVALGGVGLVSARQPVHAALFLVLTLFGVALMFIQQGAQFLAAVQVVVYAGAVVVLFLFVIMLLGVDRAEVHSIVGAGWRVWAAGAGVAGILVELGLLMAGHEVTGAPSLAGALSAGSNLGVLARSIFTSYLAPFEFTSILLVIAVIGAVVLARRMRGAPEVPGANRDGEVRS